MDLDDKLFAIGQVQDSPDKVRAILELLVGQVIEEVKSDVMKAFEHHYSLDNTVSDILDSTSDGILSWELGGLGNVVRFRCDLVKKEILGK